MRLCTKCKTEKADDQFYGRVRNGNWTCRAQCIACIREINRNRARERTKERSMASMRIPPDVRARVIELLREERYGSDIARATGVSEQTVRKIGQQEGYRYIPVPVAERFARSRAILAAATPAERNWRAEASNARWVPLGWSRW